MNSAQHLLRGIATASGLITILAPMVSLLLTSRSRRGNSIGTGSPLWRSPAAILLIIGLLGLGTLLWKPIPVQLSNQTQNLLTWIGFMIYLLSIFLYLWGLATPGRFFGVTSARGANLFAGYKLIRNGPYHFIRHPRYLGVMLASMNDLLVFQT